MTIQVETTTAYIGSKGIIYKTEDEARKCLEKTIAVNKMVEFFKELGHTPTDRQQRTVLNWFENDLIQIRYK